MLCPKQSATRATCLFVFLVALALSGCMPSAQPEPTCLYPVEDNTVDIKEQMQLPDCAHYGVLSEEQRRYYRDDFRMASIFASDLQFSQYERQDVAIAGDIANIGLTSAASVVGGTATKSMLAAAAAGLEVPSYQGSAARWPKEAPTGASTTGLSS